MQENNNLQLLEALINKNQNVIDEIMNNCSTINVNFIPEKALCYDPGAPLLWLAAAYKQWRLVETMLKTFGNTANVNATPTDGPNKGATVLWVAAAAKEWELVNKMLETFGDTADVNAAPIDGRNKSKGKTVLWVAAAAKEWGLVETMLKTFGNIADVNAAPTEEGVYKGITALWLAAFSERWSLVATMLKTFSDRADVNAAPTEGANKDITVLWWAAYYKQWDLVTTMLKIFGDTADVNAAPTEGVDKGATVLWVAAHYQQWTLVESMLETFLDTADVNAAPTEGPNKGKTVLWLAAAYKQWGLVKKILASTSEVEFKKACEIQPPPPTLSFQQLISAAKKGNLIEPNRLSARRKQTGEKYYQKARKILNKISEYKEDHKSELPEKCHLKLERALRGAEKSKGLGYAEAQNLIWDIHYAVIESYCSCHQHEDAIQYMQTYLKDHFNTAENSYEEKIYFQIGQSFFTDKAANETDEQHYQRLVKSCAFLTEAYQLSASNKETCQEKGLSSKEGNEQLLLKALSLALKIDANHIFEKNLFEIIKNHRNYSPLLKDIISAKRKLFSTKDENRITAPNDIGALCNFIAKEKVDLLDDSIQFLLPLDPATKNDHQNENFYAMENDEHEHSDQPTEQSHKRKRSEEENAPTKKNSKKQKPLATAPVEKTKWLNFFNSKVTDVNQAHSSPNHTTISANFSPEDIKKLKEEVPDCKLQ